MHALVTASQQSALWWLYRWVDHSSIRQVSKASTWRHHRSGHLRVRCRFSASLPALEHPALEYCHLPFAVPAFVVLLCCLRIRPQRQFAHAPPPLFTTHTSRRLGAHACEVVIQGGNATGSLSAFLSSELMQQCIKYCHADGRCQWRYTCKDINNSCVNIWCRNYHAGQLNS